jgi:DNA-binding MarR family transcriptional regulator
MQLDRTLTHRLHTLHKLTDMETARAYEAQLGLSLSDSRCLAAIGALGGGTSNRLGGMSVNDLARHANLNKSQASRAAQSLIDQGLVSKAGNALDKRGVALRLTRKGKAMHQRCMAVIQRRNADIFSALSPVQRATLGQLLDMVLQAHLKTQTSAPALRAD